MSGSGGLSLAFSSIFLSCAFLLFTALSLASIALAYNNNTQRIVIQTESNGL